MRLTASMGWLVVGAAWLLPWLTWPRLVTPDPHESVTLTPMWLVALLGLLVLSVLLWTQDRWLGALTAYWTAWALPATTPMGFETAYLFTTGAVAMMAVRQIPVVSHARIYQGLTIVAVLQVSYLLGQQFGVDILWSPVQGVPMKLVGTLGNPSHVAVLLALVVPVAPLFVLPYLGIGLLLTHSAIAMVAAAVGVLIAHRLSWRWWLGGLLPLVSGVLWFDAPWASWITRWEVWRQAFAGQSLWAWLLGHGPGSWIATPHIVWGEIFLQAHNEYIQVVYETGLLGLVLIVGWAWTNWARLRQVPACGSVAAMALIAVGLFPLHLAVTGMFSVVLLGLATAEGDLT